MSLLVLDKLGFLQTKSHKLTCTIAEQQPELFLLLARLFGDWWRPVSPAHAFRPARMRANLLAETQGGSGCCVYCIDWHDCSSGWCPSAGTPLCWPTNNLMRHNTHAGWWLGFRRSASCSIYTFDLCPRVTFIYTCRGI